MKRFTLLALMAGVLLAIGLIGWSGAREVGQAVASAGWGTAIVVVARAAAIAGVGVAWWLLVPVPARPPFSVCVGLRFVREAVNALLPVAQIGGDLVGARLLTFFRVDPSLAVASVVADVMVQVTTQFLFTAVGLAVLVALGGDDTIVRAATIGLAAAAPALVGFILVQRRQAHGLIRGILTRFLGEGRSFELGAVDRVYQGLRVIYAGRAGFAAGGALHLAVWFFGALEVWVALAFMGHPVSYAEALVIESLGQAVRGAAFAVPGAIGVQEGGFIALCAVFGIPAQPALALSLLKRVADLTLGVPGLLAWQVLEGRRVLALNDRPAPVIEGRGGGAA